MTALAVVSDNTINIGNMKLLSILEIGPEALCFRLSVCLHAQVEACSAGLSTVLTSLSLTLLTY